MEFLNYVDSWPKAIVVSVSLIVGAVITLAYLKAIFGD